MTLFTEPNEQLTFLGATVLSFNASIGLGSTAESSLNVELIEDCNAGQQFLPNGESVKVGDPVYFPANRPTGFNFSFGGILQSWTHQIGSGGRTFSCVVTDPRQLLENAVVIIDSYLDIPVQATNYFNVYSQAEGQVLYGNCSVYGSTGTSARGMPYRSILFQLTQMAPIIYSSTGAAFYIDFTTLPGGANAPLAIPEYYRVPGPSISILQLVQDICDAGGFQFYCYLDENFIIKLGYIDYKQPPSSISESISGLQGSATDLSYGQELRNDKTRTVLFGEQQHYMSDSNNFSFFFGEDTNPYTGFNYPVVPYAYSPQDGFWIAKRISEVNVGLYRPIPVPSGADVFTISEMDIRAAMASYDLWFQRVMTPTIQGTFNAAIRGRYNLATGGAAFGGDMIGIALKEMEGDPEFPQSNLGKIYPDLMNQPGPTSQQYENTLETDLQSLHGFVKNLGDTYYGKQFFSQLNQNICQKLDPETFNQLIFTDVPTNDGGWVEPNTTILGLSPPDLDVFKETDGRLTAFLGFWDTKSQPINQFPGASGVPKPEPDYINEEGE